jgi:glycosyltransferase involved in cell wall biosynthesis
MILTVVFYVFVVLTGIQIIYYLTFSSFLFNQKKEKEISEQAPISVIIFVKNSAVELKNNLPFILAQNYPKFEIVLINNASTDNTIEVLEAFQEQNQNIKIIDVANNEAFWGSKKYALTLGIKAAKYDHLLFTDASSEPLSEFWITEMSKKFNATKTIVLGYGKYKKKNTLTNIFIRFESLLTAIQSLSFAKLGSPFMAFSSNFGYKKSAFFDVNGFINHMKINEGEADLFIKDAASNENISYTVSKNSFVEIDTPKSFNKWIQERKISNSIKKHYKFKHRFLLNFFIFSKIFFYVLASILFFFYPWKLILPFVLAYFLIQYLIIGFSARKLKEPYLIFFLPFLEIGLLLIQISIFIANLISKPNH